MARNSVSQAVISGIRWTAGVRLLSQVSTWAITLIVIRLLAPADYGLLAMATVFVGFAAMFSELGLGMSIVQTKDIDRDALRQLFGVILTVQFALSAMLALAAPSVAIFFSEPKVRPVIQVLALQFVLGAFAVIPDALLKRELRYRTRSLIELIAVILASVLTLVLAFSGAGVWALVAGSLGTQVVRVVALNLSAPFVGLPRFSLQGMRTHVSFGGQLTLTQILGFIFTQIDVFLVGRVLGKESLGQYSVGVHLASLPNQRLSAIINQVAFPAFARMQGDLRQLHESVLLGVRILAITGFPILWGLSSVAPEFIAVVLGDKWSSSVVPLQLLALVMPLRLVGNFLPNATQAIGRPDVFLKNYVFATIVMAPAFAVGIQFGLVGVCLAWVLGFPVVFLQSAIRNAATLGLRFMLIVRAIAPAVAASSLMYAAVAVVRTILKPLLLPPLLLPVLAIAGALVYVASIWLLHKEGCKELLALGASVAGRRQSKV